jgi:hypothetical protein
MLFLSPRTERRDAARRFVEANDRRVMHPTAATRAAHDAAWLRLVRVCGGNVDLALSEAAAVLSERLAS